MEAIRLDEETVLKTVNRHKLSIVSASLTGSSDKEPKFCVSDILVYCKDNDYTYISPTDMSGSFPLFRAERPYKCLIIEIIDKYNCHNIENNFINTGIYSQGYSGTSTQYIYKLFNIESSSEFYFTDKYCEESFEKFGEY